MENRRDSILTVDVGNTSTRIGLFAEDTAAAVQAPLATCEVTTQVPRTADEVRMLLDQVLGVLRVDVRAMPVAGQAIGGAGRSAGSATVAACSAGVTDGRVAGVAAARLSASAPVAAVLSCVVPALERPWTAALERACTGRVLTVGPGLKTGMRMRYDDPAEIGPDRIADAVAARAVHGAPAIVVDLGTTTNIEVVDATGAFAGGIIAPGLALGARSLSAATARLPQVEPAAPAHVIGRSTREAMRSGVVLGEVARIDGMLDMVLAEMRAEGAAGEDPVPIVITGDDAAHLAALVRHDLIVDGTLTLRGLAELYRINRKPRRA